MAALTPSLYVATPCFGGVAHAAYMRGLLGLKAACMTRRINLQIDLGGGDALISRARAAMLARFLASPAATHLMFIDADIGFDADQVFRLLAADKPVIGGVYARKPLAGSPLGPCSLEMEPLPDDHTPLATEGLRRVASVGTGFLVIDRQAARTLVAAHPALRARLGDLQGGQTPEAAMVFDPLIDPASGYYLPDHEAFCNRWREVGGEVWADVEVRAVHWGEAGYAA